ncbi:MAG: glutamate-5-semialdehyde dehydrogenase [Armatimonas sp.]
MNEPLEALGKRAKNASRALARLTTEEKNTLLLALADALEAAAPEILAANEADLEVARAAGTSAALLDRLSLAGGRLASIAADVRAVAELPDPVGEIFDEKTLASGVRLHRKRVPLGVLGVIYEARPNVTVDIASLALKTGNAAILRGGSETLRTNTAIINAISPVLPPDAIQLIASPDRALVLQLLKLHQYVDMIIPRGGAGLHDFCRENATIPVIIGGIGVCHLFVDESANLEKSLDVLENARCQRPSVCNSVDTLLVHERVASTFLPMVQERLGARGVSFRVDDRAAEYLPDAPKADPDDFDTEWMALILGIRVVTGLDEALEHIFQHSSGHSDAIMTEDAAHAATFLNEVDSSAVFHNASTRFNDGGQFGLGAEVAISTQKLHARGPMGLDALTTYKWIAVGDYTIRASHT